eukprot:Blabericola_migrator_1__5006@NODE_25_length_21156_cov_56_925364_g22_i0_p10_GENE_NODE_25_length_21156_cov_56_925364_g22_i0NODE_25_length_21156_cov_56_925364_g22_i0_p10_ORF_typecomplete_len144_score5_78zfCHY/PF05495_12/1_6e20zfCHY/PF05495_12/4_4e02_NODE_25_length_21156_cov_56_925364_g22_i02057221003
MKQNPGTKSGCEHYTRHCALVAPCCNKIYSCHICHDEQELIETTTAHTLDRTKVKEVVCLECNQRQAMSATCTSCNTIFAQYYCSECALYDELGPVKQTRHCTECGTCRNYRMIPDAHHCDICQGCHGPRTSGQCCLSKFIFT